jgi:hypothetical protein
MEVNGHSLYLQVATGQEEECIPEVSRFSSVSIFYTLPLQ